MTTFNRTKVLTLLLAAALVALALNYAWPHMQSLTGQADGVRAEAAQLDQRIAEITDFRAHQDAREAELAALVAAVPADPALNDVIDALQQLADSTDVQWQSDAPQQSGTADGAHAWTVSASLTGSPASVMAYLDALQAAPRLFVVDALSLTEGENDQVTAAVSVRLFATGAGEGQ